MRALLTVALIGLIACGGSEEPAPEAAPAAEKEAPAPEQAKSKKGKSKKGKSKSKTSELAVPEGAKVFFVEPATGAEVTSPVKVKFGIEGMQVKPAGKLEAGTGHHHIVIGPAGIEAGKAVPKNETHIHYGGGQTEAELELEPGTYSLTMQFADGNHISYGPKMAATVEIVVK